AEIAARLGLETDEVLAALEVSPAQHTVSLDATRPGRDEEEGSELGERLGQEDDNLERVEMKALIEQAMAHLSPRQRQIMLLRFFESRGHRRLPSASLVTHDDPSVLFTVAGMVPLKPYFLGLRTPPAPRATSSQKCIRIPDIEEVGRSPRHHTFFEMLGNFSFGDYFKEGAIELAWELLTTDYGLDPAQLRPSVHPGDRDAEDLWVRIAGVPRDRVAHLEDNWWQPGPTGPCGYDSEIYWDWGGPCSCGRDDCGPECEGDRWLEIWNLVFIEFDQPD